MVKIARLADGDKLGVRLTRDLFVGFLTQRRGVTGGVRKDEGCFFEGRLADLKFGHYIRSQDPPFADSEWGTREKPKSIG
jgi:hypothetical protein